MLKGMKCTEVLRYCQFSFIISKMYLENESYRESKIDRRDKKIVQSNLMVWLPHSMEFHLELVAGHMVLF